MSAAVEIAGRPQILIVNGAATTAAAEYSIYCEVPLSADTVPNEDTTGVGEFVVGSTPVIRFAVAVPSGAYSEMPRLTNQCDSSSLSDEGLNRFHAALGIRIKYAMSITPSQS
jgi:hypothetical protein